MLLCSQEYFELCIWPHLGLPLSGVDVNTYIKANSSTLRRVPSAAVCLVSSPGCCMGRDGVFLCMMLCDFKLHSSAISCVMNLGLGFGRELCVTHTGQKSSKSQFYKTWFCKKKSSGVNC